MKTTDLRFKIARQLAGYTQQELAEAVGVRESLISRIEQGRTKAESELAEQLAKLLGKRPFELGL